MCFKNGSPINDDALTKLSPGKSARDIISSLEGQRVIGRHHNMAPLFPHLPHAGTMTVPQLAAEMKKLAARYNSLKPLFEKGKPAEES